MWGAGSRGEGRWSRKGQLEPQDISPHSCQTQRRSWSLKLVSEPLPGSANQRENMEVQMKMTQ